MGRGGTSSCEDEHRTTYSGAGEAVSSAERASVCSPCVYHMKPYGAVAFDTIALDFRQRDGRGHVIVVDAHSVRSHTDHSPCEKFAKDQGDSRTRVITSAGYSTLYAVSDGTVPRFMLNYYTL